MTDENEKKIPKLPEGAAFQEDGTVVVTLAVPVGDRKTVTLRRPRGGDTRQLDKVKGEIARGLWMISRVGSLAPEEVDDLDNYDVGVLSGVIAFFTDARPG